MNESLKDAVVAVDGGGTRCRIACEVAGVVHCVETGAANVSTDFDLAVGQIRKGFGALAGRLETRVNTLTGLPAFVGLAGVTDTEMAQRLNSALGFGRARIEDDRPAAVRGALGARDGFIAHCGTGSFLAVQKEGDMRFAGGWGPILGDEASAQWVGRFALAQTLSACDGVRSKSALTQKLLVELNGTAGIVRFATTATPAQFGALAPDVTKAAAEGDVVAEYILRTGAGYLAEMAKQLAWQPAMTVCLTGGIAAHYANYLPQSMQSCIQPPLGQPLDGALALAKEALHEHL